MVRRRRPRRGSAQSAASPALPAQHMAPSQEGGRFCPLSPCEVQRVHDTALRLLADLGLSQATPSMIDKVCARGGHLDAQQRLHFAQELVMDCIQQARRDICLYGQTPERHLDISGARVHMSSGGAAPGVFDLDSGHYREGSALDLYKAARLVDCLENIHHFSRSLVARDAHDPLHLDINTAYACLAGTAKHVSMSVSEPENVAAIADVCYRIAGGEAAFREKPFMTIMVCHVVPPMRFAAEACDTLEAAILAGFPVQLISAGQAGATSPASLAGSLVQAVAETLAGLVFAQLVDPHVAAIFAPKPLVADLRTGAMTGGGGEQAILMAAAAQMGRHYNLPTSSIAGITDAKTLDSQYGSEKTLAVTLAAQAGSNIVTQACGMQASLLGVSLEAYVADNDSLGNILRTLRGVEADEDNLSAAVIDDVCRGEGHYLGHPDTLARMKSDYFYPHIGDRKPPREWQEDGASTLHQRARAQTHHLLGEHFPNHWDPQIDEEIRRDYDILIPREAMQKAPASDART